MEADDQTPKGVRTPSRVRAGASAGEAAASPPRLQIVPWLHVVSFTREEVGRFARLTLEGELRARSRPPRDVELVVRHGAHATSHRPVETQIERRPVGGRRRGGLRIRVAFAIPPALTMDRSTEFRVLARFRGAVDLPFPALVPWEEPQAPRLSIGAVASAAALGVTTVLATPSGALAAGTSVPVANTVTCLPSGGSTSGSVSGGELAAADTSTTTPTAPRTATTNPAGPSSTTSTSSSSSADPTQSSGSTSGSTTTPDTSTTPDSTTPPGTSTTPNTPTSTTGDQTPTSTGDQTPTSTQPTSTTPGGGTPHSTTSDTGSSTGASSSTGTGELSSTSTPAGTGTAPTVGKPGSGTSTSCSTGGSTTTTGGTTSGTGTTPPQGTTPPKGSTPPVKTPPATTGSPSTSPTHHKPKHPPVKPVTGTVKRPVAGALSNGVADGSGAVKPAGGVKQTSGLKHPDGNPPAPVVKRPTPAPKPAPAVTSTPVAAGFGLSDIWGGGSALANPFTQLQLQRFAARVRHVSRPPKYLVKMYKQAGRRYHLPWEVLAAINYIETGYGRDLAVSSAGAVGWMQFMPSTWAQYGEAVNAHGLINHNRLANPWVPRDAIFSAARLLVANGAHKNLAKSVYGYNHALWYVQEVLTLAERITQRQYGRHAKPKQRLRQMAATAKLLNGIGYVWGGGHTSAGWIVQAGYDCSGFVSAVLHAGGYLRFPQTTQTLPGERGIAEGPGRWVTIYDRTNAGISNDHVIIDLNGYFWEEGGGGPAGASMVHLMRHISGSYLRSFNVVMHPRGL